MGWFLPVQLVAWWLQFVHLPAPDFTGVRYSGRLNILPLPAVLAPPQQDWSALTRRARSEYRTPKKGCSSQGWTASAWLPNRALLWLFLRWPLECEVMHWLQKCDRDRCDGVRADHYFEELGFYWGRGNHVYIDIRCDEFGRRFSPLYAVAYQCNEYSKSWVLCLRVRSTYSTCLNNSNCDGIIEDTPCASPDMIKMRKYWRTRSLNWQGVPPDQQ